eukprot:TRINITY_DN6990_c0_g2_i1.p1 TRINITY_DN6990_c0_g2~~TRINITY_DN6990_c0_g2_i1.p1  ORF type:complete len:357 (+),score=69.26 TRINITY_DN6990_c0_g2_i1:115-1185(+)
MSSSSSNSPSTPKSKEESGKSSSKEDKESKKDEKQQQPKQKPTTSTTTNHEDKQDKEDSSPIFTAVIIGFFISMLIFSLYLFFQYVPSSSSSSQIPSSYFGTETEKLRDTRLALTVQLEDVYMGKDYTLSIPRQEICHECKGHGSPDKNDVKKCSKCDGKGILLVNHRFGNFMMQSQETCSVCRGKGKVISNPCKVCAGTGIEQTNADIKVQIKPGIPEGHIITLQGQGDQAPGYASGDLHFHISTHPHNYFLRQGQHLYCNHTINLLDSLVGFKHTLRHLDGKDVVLQGNGNKVTQFGFEEVIRGKGLPSDSVWTSNGDLHVYYDIEFPHYLDPVEKETIIQLLKDEVTNQHEET